MLAELHIRGLGVIAEASVTLGGGLVVVTGETGAGKTLLITSLGLLSGARAPARLVANGHTQAQVEAVLRTNRALDGVEAEDGQILLSRRIAADGRTTARVQGDLVPVSRLGELAAQLVEIHGQGAGFALARPAVQLGALDALARTGELLDEYRTALTAWKHLEAELQELSATERDRAREADFLAFQADEIERAGLVPGEDVEIDAAISRLSNAEALRAASAAAGEAAGSDGAAGRLAEVHKTLAEAASLDGALGPLAARAEALAAEAAELSWDVRGYGDAIDSDPARLQELQERSALIAQLRRKYGDTIEEILEAGRSARERLDNISSSEERLRTLAEDGARAHRRAEALAEELSARRTKAAARLTELVNAELPALALPHATFTAACEPAGDLGPQGRDRAVFTFSASASLPAGPLGKVASGGELSRAMIAVTLALASVHDPMVMVFDEADQGIGGQAALEVARRLKRLGERHQVLVVTHLPQIAAFADQHVRVRKDRRGVTVETLDLDGRLDELSRMLGGLEGSDKARAHAEELIELARKHPKTTGTGRVAAVQRS